MTVTLARHTLYMTIRHVRELLRQPWWIAVTLVQPVIWLLLYGALFKKVVEIPGFHGGSYIEFLAPGVVVMTALFASGWSGMPLIDDIERGVTDRFLVSPVRRSALISGRLVNSALTIAIQSLIIVALALIVGASFPGGVGGVIVLIAVAVILGMSFGALSAGLALLARREETLIAVMQFLLLPLTFLSSAFMQQNLIPRWMQHVADFNPVNWAVIAGRAAVSTHPDWGLVASRAGFLVALLLVCLAFATRAFRTYQRSV
jgi:ABC-2 type transport system permease protein